MKIKVVLLFLTFSMTQLSYSQGGRGQGGQGREGGQGMDMSKINFEEAAGIIQYDLDVVYGKIKLKDNLVKEKANEVFLSYENALKEISLSQPNSVKLLKEAKTLIKTYKENRDMEKMKELMQEIKKHILIISPLTEKCEDNLNSSLEKILNEKEIKLWNKYMSSKTNNDDVMEILDKRSMDRGGKGGQ